MPEAMEMPMHSGRATRKTTTDASRSCPYVDFGAEEDCDVIE
jgi:hypothetical protein